MQLSRYFSALVRATFTPEQLAEINRRNALPEYALACATHDFCDANAMMFGAWAALYFETPDASDQAQADEMGKAWDMSQACKFAN